MVTFKGSTHKQHLESAGAKGLARQQFVPLWLTKAPSGPVETKGGGGRPGSGRSKGRLSKAFGWWGRDVNVLWGRLKSKSCSWGGGRVGGNGLGLCGLRIEGGLVLGNNLSSSLPKLLGLWLSKGLCGFGRKMLGRLPPGNWLW